MDSQYDIPSFGFLGGGSSGGAAIVVRYRQR